MLVTTGCKCRQSLVSCIYFCMFHHSHFEDIEGTVHVDGRTSHKPSGESLEYNKFKRTV